MSECWPFAETPERLDAHDVTLAANGVTLAALVAWMQNRACAGLVLSDPTTPSTQTSGANAPTVRVNSVTVGLILTEQAALFYGEGETRERIERGIPMGRFAMPADVGDICVYLASPLASYVTGAEIAAHGGGERPPFLGAD